jgi:RNase adaptor protein for sRNA GlmZ degradation
VLEKAVPPSTLQRLVTHTSCTCKSKNSASLDVRNATDSVASIKLARSIENKENLSALSAQHVIARERVLVKKHERENRHHDGLMQGSFIAVVGVQKVPENRHF